MAVALIFLIIYMISQQYHNYWSKRGFPQLNPKFIFGDIGSLCTMKFSIGGFFHKLYRENPTTKALGIYFSYQPGILINDPLLIQHVLIGDFSSFQDRIVPFDLNNDPLQEHLFNLCGQKWRNLRRKFRPCFSSAKLKEMFPIMKSCGDSLAEYLRSSFSQGVDVYEFRDLVARYNTDIISSVAFGIENDCINESGNLFRKIGVLNGKVSWRTDLRNTLALLAPKLLKFVKTTEPEVEHFIYTIVKKTVDYRKANNIERNDFLQQLIQLHEQGYTSGDQNTNQENNKITIDDVAANAYVFFVGGYETSSSTISFCLTELAKNPEVQRKVHVEIDSVFKSTGHNEITYDMLGELKYLEACLDETLRKYPILPLVFRKCNKDSYLPDSNLVIPEGTWVMISLLGLHRDPEIFDSPMKFRPDRFIAFPKGSPKTDGIYYMPFGDGPRLCVAYQLGKLTAKLALAILLSQYFFDEVDGEMAPQEIEMDPRQFLLTPKNEINLRVSQRKKDN